METSRYPKSSAKIPLYISVLGYRVISNGVDWAIPDGNQIVASHSGEVIRVENDAGGYGIHVRLWDRENKFATIYGHLQKVVVQLGEKIVCGQLLGLSNNTGYSTGPHLHFGLCRTDDKGIRLDKTNGYGGWLNPLDKRIIEWDIKNLAEPVKPTESQPIYTEDQMTAIRLERDKNWNLYQETLKELTNVKNENEELKSKVANLKDQIAKLSETINKVADEDRDSAVAELEISHKLEEHKFKLEKAQDRVLELERDTETLEEEKKALRERLVSSGSVSLKDYTVGEMFRDIVGRILGRR